MRVSENSMILPYQRALEELQSKRNKEMQKISTGKDILNISDDPRRMINIKLIQEILNRNEYYKNNIETALNELKSVDEQIYAISEKVSKLKELAVQASATGNTQSLYTLGTYVKGILTDLIKDANLDIKGQYIFSGTKTTPASLEKNEGAKNNLPFELIEGEPTENNFSGLKVIFKGNFEDRIINKDANTVEVINTKANELFGKNGTEFFESVIELYNLLTYNENGEKRNDSSLFNTSDIAKLSQIHQKIANFNDNLSKISAQNGARINRLTLISEQIDQETIRLKDFLSIQEDADIAKAVINLSREETALKYTLQVGTKLFQQSLFDFLT